MRCEEQRRSVPAKFKKIENKFYGSKIHGHKISAYMKRFCNRYAEIRQLCDMQQQSSLPVAISFSRAAVISGCFLIRSSSGGVAVRTI